MSQYQTIGHNPENGENVFILYGWDSVPGYEPGFFIQVYSGEEPDEPIVDEGLLDGITREKLQEVADKFQAKIINNIKEDFN